MISKRFRMRYTGRLIYKRNPPPQKILDIQRRRYNAAINKMRAQRDDQPS